MGSIFDRPHMVGGRVALNARRLLHLLKLALEKFVSTLDLGNTLCGCISLLDEFVPLVLKLFDKTFQFCSACESKAFGLTRGIRLLTQVVKLVLYIPTIPL